MENLEYYTQRLQCTDVEKNACLETMAKLYHVRHNSHKNGLLAAEELAEEAKSCM